MKKTSNPYSQPLELLLQCLNRLHPEEIEKRFAPDGEGLFLQEVVDVSRLSTTEALLDSFGVDMTCPDHPKPETEEWWMIYQWHPVCKQLISGVELRKNIEKLFRHICSTKWPKSTTYATCHNYAVMMFIHEIIPFLEFSKILLF